MEKVVSEIQLELCVDTFTFVKSPDLLCIFLNCFQDWIASLVLPVPQGEVDTIRSPFRLVGKDVFFKTWKPQGAGHTPYPRKHICPIDGVQSE